MPVFVFCQDVFSKNDKDRSGTMSSMEMREALGKAGQILCLKGTVHTKITNLLSFKYPHVVCTGFSLNNTLHQIMVSRYSDSNLTIDFDNFVACIVRLESMFSECLINNRILIKTDMWYSAFTYPHFSFAETFKMLDKDKNGTIELNFFEVCVSFRHALRVLEQSRV